jgi:NAD(P)-dependent dehydrogenase (short-subunit alcohol dehydrogenase family)
VPSNSASGLGRATVEMIGQNGGNVAILDLNETLGNTTASEFSSFARFFQTDVTDTDSISKAVAGTMAWIEKTGKPLGGIIPAAGIGNPSLV